MFSKKIKMAIPASRFDSSVSFAPQDWVGVSEWALFYYGRPAGSERSNKMAVLYYYCICFFFIYFMKRIFRRLRVGFVVKLLLFFSVCVRVCVIFFWRVHLLIWCIVLNRSLLWKIFLERCIEHIRPHVGWQRLQTDKSFLAAFKVYWI